MLFWHCCGGIGAFSSSSSVAAVKASETGFIILSEESVSKS
jgi:hypothetical protein